MRQLRIENGDLDLIIGVRHENLNLGHAIHYVFDELADIPGFGPVPASKTLHAIAPSFFVMWDNAIARNYKCRQQGKRYQIKYRSLGTLNIDINNFNFDYVVLVNVDDKCQLNGMWLMTINQAREIFTLRDKFRKSQVTQLFYNAHGGAS